MASDSDWFVVLGGGIAGTTCALTLRQSNPDIQIRLVSETLILKNAANIKKIAKAMEEFDVVETDAAYLASHRIDFVRGKVVSVNSADKVIKLENGESLGYKKLCICSGAIPKVIHQNPNVIGIRDTESVQNLCERIKVGRKVLIVGNGGIALELVHEIKSCSVVWAVKDGYIGNTFFDENASAFLIPTIVEAQHSQPQDVNLISNDLSEENLNVSEHRTKLNHPTMFNAPPGPSVGPNWVSSLDSASMYGITARNIQIEFYAEIKSISDASDQGWPLSVELSNGVIVLCDFVVSATGVLPNTNFLHTEVFVVNSTILIYDLAHSGTKIQNAALISIQNRKKFQRSADGALVVDSNMETNIRDIFAAGDAASVTWPDSPHWFQMRLWSQARYMGRYAAWCMIGSDEKDIDFTFEVFTHVTKFFNHRIVLLGNYNGQNLPTDEIECMYRAHFGDNFVKVVIHNNRLKGAILIGDTGLEETFENLILDGINISRIKSRILDHDFDVEDYFD